MVNVANLTRLGWEISSLDLQADFADLKLGVDTLV